MSYTIKPAGNVKAIAEQQIGIAPAIGFARLDSCIGIVARAGANAIGIHLVQMDENDHPFDEAAAIQVRKLLEDKGAARGAHGPIVGIVGDIGSWSVNGPVIKAGYAALCRLLDVGPRTRDHQGIYEARLEAGPGGGVHVALAGAAPEPWAV